MGQYALASVDPTSRGVGLQGAELNVYYSHGHNRLVDGSSSIVLWYFGLVPVAEMSCAICWGLISLLIQAAIELKNEV